MTLGLDPAVWDDYESACAIYQRYGGNKPPNPITNVAAFKRWQYAQSFLRAAGRT